MELEYDSRKNRASQVKRTHNFFSAAHLAMPLPTVTCPLSPVTWNHTFSAKERDTETGYSYFGSRYYSSDLSIWLSVDPMADKYPSTSPYVYCRNNPIILIDPNGLFETKADAREYRKEHHTGGRVRKNSSNDNFSGKYSIENKKSGKFYTKPQYSKSNNDAYMYGEDNDGVVCGPLIHAETTSSNAETVMAGTLLICAGLGADDGTLIGVVYDPLIPVVLLAGTTISAGIILFQEHHIHKSKSNWNQHTIKRSGGDPENGIYGKNRNNKKGNKNRKFIPNPNPNKRR